MMKGAWLDERRTYRYALWRRWDPAGKIMMVVGVNPSTADETEDDPTMTRVIRFAMASGHGSVVMTNLYAWGETERAWVFRCVRAGYDVVGPENDYALQKVASVADTILVAWGSNAQSLERQKKVYDLLTKVHSNPIYCLGTTKDGSPRHPLYLKADTPLEVWLPPWTPSQ